MANSPANTVYLISLKGIVRELKLIARTTISVDVRELFCRVAVFFLLCSCTPEPPSRTKAVLGEVPSWEIAPHEPDVFALVMNEKFIGTAFIHQAKLLTNSHVAVAIKYCVGEDKCDDIVATNQFRTLKCVFRLMAAPDSERCRHPIPMMAAPHSKS